MAPWDQHGLDALRRQQQAQQRAANHGMPMGVRAAEILAVHDDPDEAAERRRVIDQHVRILSRYLAITGA